MKKILFFILLFLSNELYSQSATEYYDRGFTKFIEMDYIGAISDYTKALEIDPKNAGVYYARGLAKELLEDYIGAISDYTKTIEFNSFSALSYYQRGHCKGILKDHRGAIADHTMAIEINPKDAEAYFSRGFNKISLSIGVNNINLSLKDSGCLDFSKAGELGLSRAYGAIKDLCN